MIFKQLLLVMKEVYKHLSYQSNLEESNAKKLDTVLDRIDVPHGHVVIGGEAKLNSDDIERLGHARTEVRDEFTLRFHFNKALFMEIRPEDNEKLGEILDEAKLDYMRNTLDDYAKLTQTTELAEQMRQDLIAKYEERKDDFTTDVRGLVEKMVSSERELLLSEVDKVRNLRTQIEAKLKLLDETTEEAKASCAEARNSIKASRPAVRRTEKITTTTP